MRRWWVIVALVMAVGIGVVAYRLLPGDENVNGTELSPVMRRQLAERVVRTVEFDAGVRGEIMSVARIICAARVFGAEPLRATTAADVDEVYARLYCVEVRPDNSAGADIVTPVALEFGPPAKARRPRAGNQFENDVERIFPSRMRAAALRDDPVVRELTTDVQRRVRELPPPG